jgi:carboxyl-terminal processing protease
MGLVAAGLLITGAAAVFWAGLSLGSGMVGRDAEERAAIAAFTETYQRIADDYIGTPLPADLLEGAIEGMFEVLDDPHSRYMRPGEFDAALDDARGEFEGIGAVMSTEDDAGERCETIDDSCRLRVEEVLAGAPAESAGLKAGDVVVAVDGDPLSGSTIDDSVALIRGPRGSEVRLTLMRAEEELVLPITRDTVVSQDVHQVALADGRVGYIAIDSFSTNAARDFESALEAHLGAGVEALVIDVRDDPGGFVDATVEIASQLLEDGVVYWEEDADGAKVPVEVAGDGLATDAAMAVAVLVNGGTASASEILGGALQDAGRAQLVGEPTFGKGTVQEWTQLPGDSGGFRLSVARWLTRDKASIDEVGLVPDVVVPSGGTRFRAGTAEADPGLDPQLQAALALVLDEPLSPGLAEGAGAEPSPRASLMPAAASGAGAGE